jgi:hypothetical protein
VSITTRPVKRPEPGQLLHLSQAARLLPHRPHASTLWRWCRKGYRGVRLEYSRMGKRIYVTAESLERFGEAVARAESAAA